MKRRGFFKLGLVIITTGALTGIYLVTGPAKPIRAGESTPTAIVTPTTAPTPTAIPSVTADIPLMVVVADGEILFYNEPNGAGKILSVPKDTILSGHIKAEYKGEDGTEWFLLDLAEIEGRGWVKSEELIIRIDGEAVSNVEIDPFQFCLGSAAGPSGPCGTSLAVPSEELWMRYRFDGLYRGAVLQTVVEIGDERFQSRPITWERAGNGEQLVNLVETHALPRRAGRWTIYFYVDQRLVSETNLTIRSQ